MIDEVPQPPSPGASLERARRLANVELHTIALQRRRLATEEPEDERFVMRWWADLQFLIVALRRFRRSVEIAARIPAIAADVTAAVAAFDRAVPSLTLMRNIGEHIDAYAIDHPKRHVKTVDRRQLEVGWWDGTTFSWLQRPDGVTCELNVDTALRAAEQLFQALPRTLR
jgi:hypothetical protein